MKKKISRRDFLQIAAIGATSALAVSCGVLAPNIEPEPDSMAEPTDLSQPESSVLQVSPPPAPLQTTAGV